MPALSSVSSHTTHSSPGSAFASLSCWFGCSVTFGAGMRTSTPSANAPPCGVITYTLPAEVRSAGSAGAPVESRAMRMVVSAVSAPAGTMTEAPLDSVTVPPAVPMSGGGEGDGDGDETTGGGDGAAGGGELPPPLPPPPPHPTNANKQTAATHPVRVTALTIF